MTRSAFEKYVEEAWQGIPQSFRDRFANVVLLVDDEPTAEDLDSAHVPPGGTLLGLYQGVPLSRRGIGYTLALPDRITLFQGPIERAARSRSEIPEVIEDTLWHELAHHLGMNEREVREAERRRREW